MHATAGDVLVIKGRTTDRPERRATILEVRSQDGSPPYYVKWADGTEGLTYPGPDAHVTPPEQHA